MTYNKKSNTFKKQRHTIIVIKYKNEKQVKPISKYNTPIYNYLREYANQDINVFHMPGHKLSQGIPQELECDVLQLDMTEVEGTDNLHYPESIIKQAQELAAKAFGADKTFFLVNGSTCGIQAAIMSVCARGQKIIIGRDSHKSVVSGLILSGAEPVFVYPQYNCEFGITEAISAKSIEESLCENPDAVAVLITRPNYYGICSDIEEISRIVHSHNKLLIVDEAHGAHFVFNQKLPPTALQHGADICVQSAHKTLPAVTQGAYLHIKGNKIDVERLKFNLNMLQTSSPSYIIMSYLDIARELMVTSGVEKLNTLINDLDWFKKGINDLGVYKVLCNQYLNDKAVHDPTRLVINVSKLGISGYFAEKLLRDEFKTQIEMADNENLVLITTVADNRETFSRLLEALKGLSSGTIQTDFNKICQLRKLIASDYNDYSHNNQLSKYTSENIKSNNHTCHGMIISKNTNVLQSELLHNDNQSDGNAGEIAKLREYNKCQKNISSGYSISPYKAYASQKEQIPLEESSGKICAEIVTPYPPGIPVLYPGEIIVKQQIQYITAIIQAGGKVNGIRNNKYIQVTK